LELIINLEQNNKTAVSDVDVIVVVVYVVFGVNVVVVLFSLKYA